MTVAQVDGERNPDIKNYYKRAWRPLVIAGLGALASLGMAHAASNKLHESDRNERQALAAIAPYGNNTTIGQIEIEHPQQGATFEHLMDKSTSEESDGLNTIELALLPVGLSVIPTAHFVYKMRALEDIQPPEDQLI